MYFLDARTGQTVRKAYSLTDAEYAQGFGGTGIWSTAAYDPVGRHLYAGTADSDGHTRQHPYNNAILKIDADPRRATFATVVGSYKGISEHADLDAVVGYPNNPACGQVAGVPEIDLPTFFDTSASVECLELDLDFGASPLLYDVDGVPRVGALQKAGVFHSVDTASMTRRWRFFVGPGGPFQHSGTAALDRGTHRRRRHAEPAVRPERPSRVAGLARADRPGRLRIPAADLGQRRPLRDQRRRLAAGLRRGHRLPARRAARSPWTASSRSASASAPGWPSRATPSSPRATPAGSRIWPGCRQAPAGWSPTGCPDATVRRGLPSLRQLQLRILEDA